MTIIKRPTSQNKDAAINAFIAGAPDAKATPEADAPPALRKQPEAKIFINVQMPATLLAQVDEAARALSLTRSGFIKQALARAVSSN